MLTLDIQKLRPVSDIKNGCAIAIGIFDGVHLGHRAMLRALSEESERLSVPAAVFTFSIGDSPKNSTNLLACEERKRELLFAAGVDIVITAPFSAIKNMKAADFVTELIGKEFNAKSIICGYDFRFGEDRVGDVSLIKSLLSSNQVSVITPDAVSVDGKPVSSTDIRAKITEGNVKKANSLLGYEFSFTAEVIHGKRLGRELGFPTLNQKYPKELVLPRFGVYAVKCIIDGISYGGVANIGVKPTVESREEPICETYVFGYSGDCYGKRCEIRLVEFVREEKRFCSLLELKEQVDRDKAAAREILQKECVI